MSVGTFPIVSTGFVGAIFVRARAAPVVLASAHAHKPSSAAIVFGTGVKVCDASTPWSTAMYGFVNATVRRRAGVIEISAMARSNGLTPALYRRSKRLWTKTVDLS